EQLPQLVRHQPLNNPHHGPQPTDQPNEMTSYPDGLKDTIAAIRRAADDVRHVTARLTDPNSEGTTA
ncbi:hypothetical protein ACFXHD_14355, partial [Streptomyces hydrogenans]|uniref:hypothetical protein n=1 Tax=Streptomyces hydrogenans TaxID=1873719 RepID=UPI0036B97F98